MSWKSSLTPKHVVLSAVTLLAFATFSAPPAAQAQDVASVVYVDSQRIFNQYLAYQQAQQAYQAEYDGWMADLRQRESLLIDLQEEFQAQEPMLSEVRRNEMQMEIMRKTREFEDLRQSIFGLGGLAVVRNQELLGPINAAVSKAIETVADAEDYDLVLDAQDGNIVYGNDRFDITDRVLDELQGEVVEEPDAGGEGG